MIVYHGSYESIKEPKIIKGKNTKDFGVGFYCTIIEKQAKRWAKRYPKAVLNTYEAEFGADLKILEFEQMSEKWLDFIIDSRAGKSHDYDVVIGSMADDQVYNYITDYIDGVLTREQFWVLAKFKYPTHQIVFSTPKALKCLKFISSQEVNE